ncbi:hypothetical protein HP439_11430 [Sphingobacterium shayense]|uniref:hypothetical protein n=1 Tax=Sphingobacterium shayense TaxID=626343 RepID=UPI001554DBAA|nr:hypothetical protein [Sphingobacterium shayense]NQD71332.1 hypothetical protein [Sphingobacterium shayense]
MFILYFCTIYKWLLDSNNWKDFIVPSAAIVGPILLTLSITSRDRKINAKNREIDFNRSESEKMELILSEVKKTSDHEKRLSSDFQFYFESMMGVLTTHLSTLDKIVQNCTPEKLPTLSVAVFTNKHLHALQTLDYTILSKNFEKQAFAQYLTSIDLMKDLYTELDLTVKDYSTNNDEIMNSIEINLYSLFYELDRLALDHNFNKDVLRNLLIFRNEYNTYIENYDGKINVAFPAYISSKIPGFKNEQYLSSTVTHPHLNELVRDLELSLMKIERLCLSKRVAFFTLRNAFFQHKVLLSEIVSQNTDQLRKPKE